MELTRFTIREEAGIRRHSEPVTTGIPLARGLVFTPETVILTDTTGAPVQSQLRPLGYWKDGSIRWLQLDFLASLAAGEKHTFILMRQQQEQARETRYRGQTPTAGSCGEEPAIEVTLQHSGWQARYNRGPWLEHRLCFHDAAGNPLEPLMTDAWMTVAQGPVYSCHQARLRVGDTAATAHTGLKLYLRLTVYHTVPLIRCDLTLHNPGRARHQGGLWDLGDPGSLHFRGGSILVTVPGATDHYVRPQPEQEPVRTASGVALKLYQDSSGGDNWNSRNHQDAGGQIIPRFRGYRLYRDGVAEQQGSRAQPVAGVTGPQAAVHATLCHFWQNFPSGLQCREQQLELQFFPTDVAAPYELQGGEKKTRTTWLYYGNQEDRLAGLHLPLLATLPAATYEQTGAFPWFVAEAPRDGLDDLIREGLTGPHNFFAKREQIDEYGWRNFGDLFADHESMYRPSGEPPYISHYNNQYDAIYGFARQYALSGDRRWYQLMDDLARHVTDIDIYDTEQDRCEYNGGLLWHTDHYLDAHTATHRTFSRHNRTSSTPGQTGGGPAAEHCYTTGLLYHYWMTGNPDSRDAVLKLARWMRNSHEGVGGLLEQLLAIRKQDIPRLQRVMRRDPSGIYRYPFTRGTGNYINALLDASLLEPDKDWLELAERVIRNTISPDDNIAQRQLLVAETGWSYLVLLAALTRYLWIKAERDESSDPHYHYTLDSLHHYWQWMARNERPFLEDAGALEFPNHTWVAQDIRKAMLMFQAAAFSPGQETMYREQARRWLDYVVTTLKDSPERHFTRIQVILLQNYGPQHVSQPLLPREAVAGSWDSPPVRSVSTLTHILTILSQIGLRLARGLASFRPSRERHWMRVRMER